VKMRMCRNQVGGNMYDGSAPHRRAAYGRKTGKTKR
jgi:hypothetical protein